MIFLELDENAVLETLLKYSIDNPDQYVNKYNFYYQETYESTKTNIIDNLYKDLQNKRNVYFFYDEELLVLWTLINIYVQLIDNNTYIGLLQNIMKKLAPYVGEIEKKIKQ